MVKFNKKVFLIVSLALITSIAMRIQAQSDLNPVELRKDPRFDLFEKEDKAITKILRRYKSEAKQKEKYENRLIESIRKAEKYEADLRKRGIMMKRPYSPPYELKALKRELEKTATLREFQQNLRKKMYIQ